jgi:DNA-binding NtrC family response regulator
MHEPHFAPHVANVSSEVSPSFKGKSFQEAKHDVLTRFEREYFAGLYDDAKGNISEIARRAGMERAHVRTYLKRHGIVARPSEPEG